ncbi:hypothetical protein LJC32_05200 [Oscillospiraceae bacterium OttesenSCG-928-F05]|nr:hypothetical protein [Oscillospiraceae bacterium OttesenSCG-928-F05]
MTNSNKNLINILSACISYPLFEHLYSFIFEDTATLEQVYITLSELYESGNLIGALNIIKLLYSIVGFEYPFGNDRFPETNDNMDYLLANFLMDFEDYLDSIKYE